MIALFNPPFLGRHTNSYGYNLNSLAQSTTATCEEVLCFVKFGFCVNKKSPNSICYVLL